MIVAIDKLSSTGDSLITPPRTRSSAALCRYRMEESNTTRLTRAKRMKMNLAFLKTIYLGTNVGNSRQNQEDNAILPSGSFLDADIVKSLSENRQTHEAIYKGNFENGFFVAVSDGMGGYATDKHIAEKTFFVKINQCDIDKTP